MSDAAKGQGKGSAVAVRGPPKTEGRTPKRTSSNLSLTPKTKLFLGQATPLALCCQKEDGHFDVSDLLSKWTSRVAERSLRDQDDFTATVLCLTMAQMMIDRAVRRLPDEGKEIYAPQVKDLYAAQGKVGEWASSLKETWESASPLGDQWFAKAEEWLGANQSSQGGLSRMEVQKMVEAVVEEAFMQKGEVDMDMERVRLGKLRETQIGAMNWDKLKPVSLKGLNWKEAKHASYIEEAKVVIVELADDNAIVLGGNTHNAVHAVAARGILQTLHIKLVPSKILQPLLHAEWEECIRSVVGAVDAAHENGMIEFLTGKNFNKEDFGLAPASAWKREVLIVQELSTACRQPLLEGGPVELTTEQFEDIGKICAADLLFNNTKVLAEQVGLVKTADGEKVTSMVQYINAEPDGLRRNAYMGQLGELLENVFSQEKQEMACEDMRKVFWWGDLQPNDEQMGHVLSGMREGLKNMAAKAWTKESLTKLIKKTFRNVRENIGMSSWEEILEFLTAVQDEIEEIVEGRTTIVGMCGTKSVVSLAVDF